MLCFGIPLFSAEDDLKPILNKADYLRFTHYAQDMKVFQDFSAYKSKSLDNQIEIKTYLIDELEFQKKKDI